MTETKCVLVGHRHPQNSDSDCFGWQRAESNAMRFILEWTCVVVLPHGPLTHMRTSWTAHASRCLICSFGYALLLHMLIAKNFMIEGRIPLFGTMLGSAAQSGPQRWGCMLAKKRVRSEKWQEDTETESRRHHPAFDAYFAAYFAAAGMVGSWSTTHSGVCCCRRKRRLCMLLGG